MKRVIKHNIVTEIIINAPAYRVWRLLTDLNRYERWNPFMIRSSGEVKPNTRLVNTMHTGSTTMTFKPTVLQVVPNEYFDWLGHLFIPGLFDGHHYFRIETLNENQVKLIHGENFSGLLASVIFRKIGKDTRLGFIRMNQALKLQAEKAIL